MNVTEAAVNKTREVLEKQQAHAIRVLVKGGGCSGFQYGFEMIRYKDEITEDDNVEDNDGVLFVLDPISSVYLAEAEMDYKEEAFQANFVLKVPSATSRCGCGQSFGF